MNAQAIHAFDGDDRHTVGIGELRVLLCEERGEWLAQGIEIDYAASGDSLDEARRRFEKGLTATVHLHLQRYQSIERLLQFSPPSVWQRLNARDTWRLTFVTAVTLGGPEYDLEALPFGQLVYLRAASKDHAPTAEG